MQYQNENKVCQNCKNDFVIESEDFSFYEKIKVPPPTFCPECRMQRRFAFRNESNLFKVKDCFTEDTIFSLYPESSNMRITTQQKWFSDDWSAEEFGKDYDFSKNFFTQVIELEKQVPIYNLNVKLMVNSQYSGNATALKNCYLCFNSNYSENCMYANGINFSKDCIDDSHVTNSEICYESFWLYKCYQSFFSYMCVESTDIWFSRDCLGCSNLFGCTNLRKKSYCIFNKQYDKNEYFEIINSLKLNTIKGVKEARELVFSFWKTQINKNHQGLQNLNSYGSYVSHSKNVKESYLVQEGENLKYCQYLNVPKNKDCYDVSIWGENNELCYETSISGDNPYFLKFCVDCWPNNRYCEYSFHLKNCSDCFGCVGLKNKQYCILNKQYSKEEYFEIVEKIKNHMNEMPYIDSKGLIYKYGEFFPIELSPLGYNITINMEHFPLTKEKVLEYGYNWTEENKGKYEVTKNILDFYEIPISNLNEDIINEVFACTECNSPYKILLNEFLFLKRNNLPIPDFCNICRKKRRIDFRLKPTLYDMKCMCNGVSDITNKFKNTALHDHGENSCPNEFKTGFNPKNSDIVYCEKCYQQEVY